VLTKVCLKQHILDLTIKKKEIAKREGPNFSFEAYQKEVVTGLMAGLQLFLSLQRK